VIIRSIDWLVFGPLGLKRRSPPLSFTTQELHQPTLPGKITVLKNPSSTIFKTTKNPKCLTITSATTSTLSMSLTMWQITIQLTTRSRKFCPGYHYSNPRYDTTTSKAVGSRGWENGSYKPRNIETGLVESVGAILKVQPCFATEVPGSAKHTLGKRGKYQRKKRYC